MAKKNVASGSDVVAVQVGRVTDRSADGDQAPAAAAKSGSTVNIRSGNAQVDVQADEITGGLRL